MILHHSPDEPIAQSSRNIRSLIRQGAIVLGGNKKLKLYGTLHCASGKRMKPANRVFFALEQEAIAAGYRPCGHCLRAKYLAWKRSEAPPSPPNILISHGEAHYYPEFFPPNAANSYYDGLLREIPWQQQPIKIFGNSVLQPRLTAWYGDPGRTYSYSGITLQPRPWTNILLAIKEIAERTAGVLFTGALLNLYRDGNDSMGWHRDNEKELGRNPTIGSVSFGAARRFQLRRYEDKSGLVSIDLTHGSYLLMQGETQHYWEHRVAKTAQATGTRINITFRVIH